jgi:hypothetical protein
MSLEPPILVPTKRIGRPTNPLAKSKDPNRKNCTLILNINTYVDAQFYLKKSRSGEDMSDLVERLLQGWNMQHKP